MQRVAMKVPGPVKPSPFIQPGYIHDKGIAFPLSQDCPIHESAGRVRILQEDVAEAPSYSYAIAIAWELWKI